MHPYPPQSQPAHSLPHEIHPQLPLPPTTTYPPAQSGSQLPSMSAPPPSTGYPDPYGHTAPVEPVPTSASPVQEVKSAEQQALSRENLKAYSTTDGTRRYAYVSNNPFFFFCPALAPSPSRRHSQRLT